MTNNVTKGINVVKMIVHKNALKNPNPKRRKNLKQQGKNL